MFGNKTKAAQAEIDSFTHWYHGFEVLPDVRTAGEYQLEPIGEYLSKYFQIDPASLKNKTVLDIATFDGGFAYGFEDLGARVHAIDLIDQSRTGFALAKRVRKSPITFDNISVYDLKPGAQPKFDFVHFSGLHYHLKHPILAVEKINSVLKDGGVLFGNGASGEFMFREKIPEGLDEAKVHAFLKELPIAYYDDGAYNRDPTNWIFFTDRGYSQMMQRAGFRVEFANSLKMADQKSRATCYFKAVKVREPDPEYWDDNHKLK